MILPLLKLKKMKNKFREFNEGFFPESASIVWFDKEGFLELDKSRVVKFEISTRTTHNQYEGYVVTIIDKKHGKVAQKYFHFNDYIEFIKRNDDGRANYAYVSYCDRNNDFSWYVDKPKDTNPMVNTIFNWIELFR